MSQSQNSAPWPPRSPHDVLLSTPGGRKRLRNFAERTSVSPTPTKRTKTVSMDADAAEDDDEETLQLQLQEIQARLKLKKLQKTKVQQKLAGSDEENEIPQVNITSLKRTKSLIEPRQSRQATSELRIERSDAPTSQTRVHVPASPVRRQHTAEPVKSPGRIALGIDKGLSGRDVSLRKAPSLRRADSARSRYEQRKEPSLYQGHLRNDERGMGENGRGVAYDKPSSFSERLAASRSHDASQSERRARIQQAKSKAFDIDEGEMEGFRREAALMPDIPYKAPEYSREQILKASARPKSGLLRQDEIFPRSSQTRPATEKPVLASSASIPNLLQNRPPSKAGKKKPSKAAELDAPQGSGNDATHFEPYSSIHLSKRIVPHNVLTRTLNNKKTFHVQDLLRQVVAPDFFLPDIDGDIVLLAIVASKSDPRSQKTKGSNEEKSKYMVLTLTDLKWELELFLFGSSFDKFWKLSPGSVIAILNPSTMPPPPGKKDTGRFALTLNSSDDIIIEIGTARDLGFCKTMKKDGKLCDSWVDKRHTEFCDFHVNETLKKTRAGRMEVNTMSFGPKQPPSSVGARRFNSKDMTGYLDGKERSLKMGQRLYVHSDNRNAAHLIDNDHDADAFTRGTSKEEQHRKRLADKEREDKIVKNLGSVGSGLGADYMRVRSQIQSDATDGDSSGAFNQPAPDVAALGLLGGKGIKVQLSPLKRKRGTNIQSSDAMGWGANLGKELGRMRNGESLHPARKKTRFVTDRGIKEAGRESFGGEAIQALQQNDGINDDDDDLDII